MTLSRFSAALQLQRVNGDKLPLGAGSAHGRQLDRCGYTSVSEKRETLEGRIHRFDPVGPSGLKSIEVGERKECANVTDVRDVRGVMLPSLGKPGWLSAVAEMAPPADGGGHGTHKCRECQWRRPQ